MRHLAPEQILPAVGGYSHGVVAEGDLVFVSGQTPEAPDGSLASEPEAQLRQIWANVAAVVEAAGLTLADLVHVRTYLSDRSHREVNSAVRADVLGSHKPALTVVICQLYDQAWVAEIEAVAERR